MRFSSLCLVRSLRRIWLGVALTRKGPLWKHGWFESVMSSRSIDRDGRPIPWFPYAVLNLLESKVPATVGLQVGEYGCGNSTLWWAKYAQRVVAVEHDDDWSGAIRRLAPDHVQIVSVLETPAAAYSAALRGHGLFDVVVIDGRNRVACAEIASTLLTARGIIIWDDTERPQYAAGVTALQSQGFRALSLVGLGPVTLCEKQTSIFYRSQNWLGL